MSVAEWEHEIISRRTVEPSKAPPCATRDTSGPLGALLSYWPVSTVR